MTTPQEPSNVKQLPRGERADAAHMALDLDALESVRRSVGRDTPSAAESLWRKGLIKLLNDSLATELVCVLRYKRHHYTAHGLASPSIAEEFAVHAAEEMVHADRLARRIVQLGGQPDFAPATLVQRSHAAYDDASALASMIQADLTAERVAIEAYSQLVRLVGDRDPTTRRLLEDILGEEQKHADELQGWLVD
jgi:bacterioferritin